MKKITIKGRLNFNETEYKKFSANFKAELHESASFQYGNGTAVTITFEKMENGGERDNKYIDTRYDTRIKKDKESFINWIKEYFKDNYRNNEITIYKVEIEK